MNRKLAVLFDGTWNTIKDRTNVVRLSELLATGSDGGEQPKPFYDPGVGVHALDWLSGGMFGFGLSKNIRDGYGWLAENFRPGDELFLFGFSRGAYTARSLAGLIRKCGILRVADKGLIQQAYDLYRDKDIHPDNPEAAAFRASFAQETRIRFIGVWDTVGSLGIPATGVPFSRDYYQWHDTELSKIVDYAYHALAIDEHRKDFAPAVWTVRKPENVEVEQRWFVGAHSNVGGGYRNDPLPKLALAWLQHKAKAAGLGFKADVVVSDQDPLADINDSYSEFMFGLYKHFKGGKRHYRAFGRGVNETVDDSVWKRWEARPDYRPPTLSGIATLRH
ncbi:MAG TPA: DUF2235 domain-containing protein [Acidiferrobacterales bacterium]|nr:DUF2235 domain-containing protein [Acidiferrobacterales bacterium]